MRLHAGSYRREADLAVPAHSSLSEVLDELLALCGAPLLTRPWQALTAGGQVIEPTTALAHTGLRDGDTLLLGPQRERVHPVLLDATEALTEETTRSARPVPPSFLAHVTATTALFILVVALSHWLPLWVAFLPTTIAALILTLWTHPLPGVIATGTACAGASGFFWIYRGQPQDWPAYALLTGLLSTAAALVLFGLAAHGLPIRFIAVASTVCVLVSSAVAAWFVLRDLSGTAALTTLLGFFLVALSPRLATACAGLAPPRLPSAGQDLGLSDAPLPHIEGRARRARLLYEGIHLGLALIVVPALLGIGFTASRSPAGLGFGIALVCGIGLIFALHALRHPHPLVLCSHAAVSLAAIAALAVAAGSSLAVLAIAGILCLAGMSMPWWLPRLPAPEPTQLLWWERLESLAIAAIVPLCLHLAGVLPPSGG
ncbi:type VII secretion integral membrane protein EccD [Corynebacterium sp. zg-331]|uniref:type VII secretion integral membrane protein EccD n=1 Tax=unclassified Corynebacterium TaxID=2624378 RepID=UPI0016430426|nr:type VII secretion integral membrane protein EccD [Corynebacterium sp. zg-331]